MILAAALLEKDSVRRWVPWLGAYSGARVSELCQLRAGDVVELEGIWCMKFDPEAGPLKNSSSERTIPLHPALIDVGFLKFVAGVGSGPLFPHLQPDKFGKRGGNGTKVSEKVGARPRSAKADGLRAFTVAPVRLRLRQYPIGATTTPGMTSLLTFAIASKLPRSLKIRTGLPSPTFRARASFGLTSTNCSPA